MQVFISFPEASLDSLWLDVGLCLSCTKDLPMLDDLAIVVAGESELSARSSPRSPASPGARYWEEMHKRE